MDLLKLQKRQTLAIKMNDRSVHVQFELVDYRPDKAIHPNREVEINFTALSVCDNLKSSLFTTVHHRENGYVTMPLEEWLSIAENGFCILSLFALTVANESSGVNRPVI